MQNKIRNICLAAHVDAGKTSLAEQILFQSGAVRKLGSVDGGSSYFDSSPIEIKRGITIFSEQSSIQWKNHKINVIDTPGHLDFLSELERTLSVVDGVIIILSAVEGVQQNTETIWEIVQRKKIPTMFFINKIDYRDFEPNKVFQEIINDLTTDAVLTQTIDKSSDRSVFYDLIYEKLLINDESLSEIPNKHIIETRKLFLERIAEKDDQILEKYLQDDPIVLLDITNSLRKLINNCDIFPVIFGSAKTGLGIPSLLNYTIDLFSPQQSPSIDKLQKKSNSMKIYKIKNDEKDGKMTYVKVLSGQIKTRDIIANSRNEECKIAQIRSYFGNKCIILDKLETGDIGILFGLKNIVAGEILGSCVENKDDIFSQPLLQSSISPMKSEHWPQLSNAIMLLSEENPLIGFEWNPEVKEMYINIMGPIHKEILEEQFYSRFNLPVNISKPVVMYYETILDKSRGFCHFEPKKHYAEVEFVIEPNERGGGVLFTSLVSTDELPVQYQKAIEKAIPEALHRGALVGNPVMDIRVKLIAGKHHLEHTHGGDFRIASIRAIQQALENTRNALLEPIVEFHITISRGFVGRVMADIARMKGYCKDPLIQDDLVVLTGKIPLATSIDYPQELAAFSAAKGTIIMKPCGYHICHNQKQILEMLNNQELPESTNNDILYNSVSLFRAKRKMKKIINERLFDDQNI